MNGSILLLLLNSELPGETPPVVEPTVESVCRTLICRSRCITGVYVKNALVAAITVCNERSSVLKQVIAERGYENI